MFKDTATHRFGEQDSTKSFIVSCGDLIYIQLDEYPSTGYKWTLGPVVGLSLVSDEFVVEEYSGPDIIVGAGGVHEWVLEVKDTGIHSVVVNYSREWEDSPIQSWTILLKTSS